MSSPRLPPPPPLRGGLAEGGSQGGFGGPCAWVVQVVGPRRRAFWTPSGAPREGPRGAGAGVTCRAMAGAGCEERARNILLPPPLPASSSARYKGAGGQRAGSSVWCPSRPSLHGEAARRQQARV
eukprot:scaffold412_cov388-Prasinococcus_capsulatus_cf.AAC.7